MKKAFGGETDRELGEKLGLNSSGTVSTWRKRENVPFRNVQKAAAILRISASGLLAECKEGGGGNQSEGPMPTSAPSPADDKQARRIDGFILVPLFNVAASAGGGVLVPEEEVIDRLAFKEEWIKQDHGVNPSDLALITTIGDSMEPTLRAGDMILLDKSVETVKDEAVYAFLVDGMLLIKRVRWEADGGLSLLSDNSLYSPVVISKERKPEPRVVGRLIWAGRRF
jgi:phage repressor protein C with HTH and peptisase S24 domain